jgi:hypothetical protein
MNTPPNFYSYLSDFIYPGLRIRISIHLIGWIRIRVLEVEM